MYLVVPPGGSFRETRRIELGPRVLTLGRGEACDVRVDVPGVDGEHVRISEVALIAIGPDCAIGDVPLDPGSRRLVTPGDEIQIGSVVVALEGDDPSVPRPSDSQPIPLRPKPEGPRVRVVEGPNFGDELTMKEEGREYSVGRNPSADLVLEDREVSREHIRLLRRGYTVFIKDLSSTRGSWLGRAAVYTGATIEWTRPRMLRLGASVLSLELPDAIRKSAPPPTASAPHTPGPRSGVASSAPPPPSSGMPLTSVPPVADAPRSVPPVHASAAAFGASTTPATSAVSATPAVSASSATPAPASAPAPAAIAMTAAPTTTPPAAPKHARTAWKGAGTTVGRGAGVLLLALAALAVLGALFVVFSLLE